MRGWYTDIVRKPHPERLDWYDVGQWVHAIISAAGGAFLILVLAFVLTGARL